MKRNTKNRSKQKKQANQARGEKLHLLNVRWKDRKRAERKHFCEENAFWNEQNKKKVRHIYDEKKYKRFTRRNAPIDFSIIGNPEKVISFCNDLRRDYHRQKKVFVNLEKVNNVTNESLGLLVSNMMLFQNSNLDFDGNFPNDDKSKAIVVLSGFLQTLYSRKRKSVQNISNAIYTHSTLKPNSDLIAALMDSCSKFLWGQICDCDGLYNALIELMLNTYEHADEIEGRQKWWVTMTKDKENEKVTFSFIDYGRGIITTLRNAQNKRHRSIVTKILIRLGDVVNSSALLLKEVLEGALIISEKEGSNYGNGLHSIYDDMQDNRLDNVIIITNNVYADLKNENYQMMNVSFPGTFVSFEINKNTIHGNQCSNTIYPNT